MPSKLHPLSIPYRILQSSIGMVPVIVLIAFFLGQSIGYAVPLTLLMLVVGVGAIGGWHVAYYQRFEYEMTPDTFDIRSGVVSRRNREIPYRRIQNVDISRTMLQRAIGVAELRLETAGGTTSEAHLRYVGYDEAKRLQDDLRNRERQRIDPESDEENIGTTLYEITQRDLGVLAVASLDLRVASFLVVIFSFAAPSLIIDILLELPINPIAVIAAIALVVIIASGILSGGSAIINNYGFILSRVGDELRYERGLLQRYDGSIPLDKVQTLVIQENVLKRLVGYASLTVETAGYGPGSSGAESARAVPISRRETTFEIAKRIEPSVEDVPFHRPARRARLRYTWQYTLLVAALTILAFGIEWWFGFGLYWWAIPFTLVLAPVAAHLKWKHRGYAVLDEAVITRSGFWRRRTHVVPYYRIQIVDESQTVLQRRWRIATVLIDTAGSSGLVSGSPTAYDLDDQEATVLREHISERLQLSLQVRKRRRRGVRDRFIEGVRGVW